ncbi:MAG: hypothetical protein K2K74_15285 [Lachnospiraceae bacterium]|nr:hypothetical protein [Lachnospiraceae bacterium]
MLKDCGCRVMAWYPLGHGDKALMEEPVFASLAIDAAVFLFRLYFIHLLFSNTPIFPLTQRELYHSI